MNPTEMNGEWCLMMKAIRLSRDHCTTGEGKLTFLQRPCRGCGSTNHSLLTKVDEEDVESDFTYQCRVVDHQRLYPSGDKDEIRISFRLRADAYAWDCQYKLDQALDRLPVLTRADITSTEQPGYFDTFMNRVRSLCIERELTLMRK